MTAAIASDAEIVAAALACIKAGISIVPIDHRTKRPAMHLLPTGEDGKPTWKPYQSQIADEATVRSWFERGCKAFAVVCGDVSGGLLVLDFDEPRFYEAWRVSVGARADGIPIQQTGGGGFQALMLCTGPGGNDNRHRNKGRRRLRGCTAFAASIGKHLQNAGGKPDGHSGGGAISCRCAGGRGSQSGRSAAHAAGIGADRS